ncbi:MAG TPA: hypothetical protein VFV19_02455 [Candidatus Polarisedimenticolaceae bacterium]|nr:hypothetical protein [Candidatus Polarisedimenticolaceae bacterium]
MPRRFLVSLAFSAGLLAAGTTALAAPDPGPPPSEAAPPADQHRGPDYIGEAAFVGVGTLTVVYPAGPGEPVDDNRRSAVARARWLTSAHKNKVEVAADDQLTDEQKKGNLLILGWSNRLLGSPGIPRPFTHDETGTRFVGVVEPNPGVDLLFFNRNPLNWPSFLVFWSRIDPERDRSQPVPRIGSDWAMYRDYQPIRQGMFKPGQFWPPQRDPTAEADHSSGDGLPAARRGTFDSARYHIVYDAKKIPDAEIKAIADARETALTKAIEAVGAPPEGFKIYLVVYEDETSKRDATGIGDPTHSVLPTHEIYMVRRFARSTNPHEEIHVVGRAVLGPCFSTALYEGYALSLDNLWRGYDMPMHAAMLRRASKLPGPSVLLDEERLRALPDEIALPASGVFVTWLRETYGPGVVKKVYGWSDGQVATFASRLGTTEDAMATAFATWADGKVVAMKSSLEFMDAEDEAKEKQLVSDWPGMSAALKKALVAKPGDPQTLFNLASAQMRADDLPGAEASLKALLTETLPADSSRFLAFGHYQLGRVYDLGGRRKAALAEYDAVLALPDDHGSHDLARQRKESPATKEQLE